MIPPPLKKPEEKKAPVNSVVSNVIPPLKKLEEKKFIPLLPNKNALKVVTPILPMIPELKNVAPQRQTQVAASIDIKNELGSKKQSCIPKLNVQNDMITKGNKEAISQKK